MVTGLKLMGETKPREFPHVSSWSENTLLLHLSKDIRLVLTIEQAKKLERALSIGIWRRTKDQLRWTPALRSQAMADERDGHDCRQSVCDVCRRCHECHGEDERYHGSW